ncbi:MAG: hypothetical protein EPN88_06985 [Bacteroidetes bacterium]|nr:MAG: hypothetical protein EPN88_06985 [Bacteroidota bacterium]
MKKLNLFLLITSFILFILAITLPAYSEVDPKLKPEKVTVTCPDGTRYSDITVCFSGTGSCSPDANPCNN